MKKKHKKFKKQKKTPNKMKMPNKLEVLLIKEMNAEESMKEIPSKERETKSNVDC